MFWKPAIRFAEVDVAELSRCQVGDKLKLWTSPEYDRINAYRPGSIGGDGRVGALTKADNHEIALALAEGRRGWLEILSIDRTNVKFEAHVLTLEEVAAEKAAAASKLRQELLTPLRKHAPMSVELRAPEGYKFKLGQRYAIDVPPIDEYVNNPQLDVALTTAEGAKACAIPPAAQRRLLLRAHFAGMNVHMLVVAVAEEVAWAGDRDSVWKESAATARVVMLKPGRTPA